MSEENVDIVRRVIASLNPRAWWELFDEYIVFDAREFPLPDFTGVQVGREVGTIPSAA